MRAAAAELQFEVAARLRDEVGELKKELRQMREAGLPDAGARAPPELRGFAVLQDRHKSPAGPGLCRPPLRRVRVEPWRHGEGDSA